MPLPSESAEEYFLDYKSDLAFNYRSRPGLRAWICCMLILLNASVASSRCLNAPDPGKPTLSQRTAFLQLVETAQYLCDLKGVIPRRDWGEYLNSRAISYTGEDHLKAQRLKWAQIEPGLPPEKHCASISVVDLCDGPLLDYFLHPYESLVNPLPNEEIGRAHV